LNKTGGNKQGNNKTGGNRPGGNEPNSNEPGGGGYRRPRFAASVRACLALFKLRTLEAIQYRVAALAGASIEIFWALIEVTVFTIFYQYSDYRADAPLTFQQILAYVWLGQILHGLTFANIDEELLAKIVTGDVGVELCRPLDLYFHWFAKSAAGKFGRCWWQGLITLAVGCAMPSAALRLSPPASAAGFALFLVSVAALFMLSSAYGMLITAVRLNVAWGDGPAFLMSLVCGLFSGAYLPLPLWPQFMQGFLAVQPFAGQLDLPVRLYSGAIQPGGAAAVFALQIVWTLAFIAAGRLIMRGKITKIIVQGG
jgi:ABC-2 type transport system permease protein